MDTDNQATVTDIVNKSREYTDGGNANVYINDNGEYRNIVSVTMEPCGLILTVE